MNERHSDTEVDDHRINHPLLVRMPPRGILVGESMHGRHFHMDAEQHDFHECYALLQGRITLNMDTYASPLKMGAGSFCLIPRTVVHQIEDNSQATLLLLCFSQEFVCEHEGRKQLRDRIASRRNPILRPGPHQASLLHKSLHRIISEQTTSHVGSDLAIESEVNQFLLNFARLPDLPSGESAEDRVAQVIHQISQSFYEEWDIDKAANHAHLSRRRFTELFKEQTGKSFTGALNEMRLQYASTLLRRDESTIPGAAIACGINDLSNFYRLFRKQFGVAPKKWLEQNGCKEISGDQAV